MVHVLVWLLVVCVTSCLAQQDGVYKLYEGVGRYKLHTDRRPWGSAWRTCNREGAHLLIVNSVEEAAAIEDILKDTWDAEWISVGFHDLFLNGQYVTVFGLDVNLSGYTAWADNEPNNQNGIESCGTINKLVKLNDHNCNLSAMYICEQELTEENYQANFPTWVDHSSTLQIDLRLAT